MLWELLNSHDWSSSGTLRLQPDGTSIEVIARRVLDGPRAHFVLHFADLAQLPAGPPNRRHNLGARPQTAAQPVSTQAVRWSTALWVRTRHTAASLRGQPLSDKSFEHIVIDAGQATDGPARASCSAGIPMSCFAGQRTLLTADADLLAALVADASVGRRRWGARQRAVRHGGSGPLWHPGAGSTRRNRLCSNDAGVGCRHPSAFPAWSSRYSTGWIQAAGTPCRPRRCSRSCSGAGRAI